jgi:16S rRNA G966 N2-methylase RsmD
MTHRPVLHYSTGTNEGVLVTQTQVGNAAPPKVQRAEPYYQDEMVTLYHGDCLEILPTFAADEFDCVFADPPYGVGKADWDDDFPTAWMDLAARVAPTLAVTPGVWNLAVMPTSVADLDYRWTLAAHLRNGRGRGALGRGNWIPCYVYTRAEEIKWTTAFADWCDLVGVTRDALANATGTSDMAGWWTSRIERRSQIPSAEQWALIRSRHSPPARFDAMVEAEDPCRQGVDSASFVVGDVAMADHPSPKPLNVMRWFLERLPGYRLPGRGVLDPFAGSGTTLVAAREEGRRAVGIEKDERYCEVIATRLAQGVLDFGDAS